MRTLLLPNRALSDRELIRYARLLKIPHFRGVFMRDALPRRGPWKREASVVNLDDSGGPGTHWVCFRKNGNKVEYFDSYGDLRPPKEVQRYLKGSRVSYNRTGYQTVHSRSEICGHLCLAFLALSQ